MGFYVSADAQSSFEPVSEGLHTAICTGLVDLGRQYSPTFDTWKPKTMLLFSVMDEYVSIDGEDKPRQISKEFGLSFNEKSTLRKMLRSWRGREFTEEELQRFDLRKILGVGCQLQVVHKQSKKGNTFADVDSIVSWPKGVAVPAPPVDIIAYSLDREECPDQDAIFGTLPEWIQNKIKASQEWQAANGQLPEIDDRLPFDEEGE